MDFRSPESPRRQEPVLPMVNLVFLLLVFFLMVATLAPPAPVPVEPPRVAGAQAADGRGARLHLDAQGVPHLEAATGEAALAAARAAAAEGPLVLRADRRAPGPALASVLAALEPAQVILLVDPEPAGLPAASP
jgi:biopolymer transport protein ExbD